MGEVLVGEQLVIRGAVRKGRFGAHDREREGGVAGGEDVAVGEWSALMVFGCWLKFNS